MDFRSIQSFVNSPGSDGLRYSPSPPSESPGTTLLNLDEINNKPLPLFCQGCGNPIDDRWMLHVGEKPFHVSCLRCCTCLRTLDSHSSCFVRDGRVYCKFHYMGRYGTKCAGCSEPLHASDWVRRARDLVFHLDCFKCSTCLRKLATGDTCILRGDTMLCSEHGEALAASVAAGNHIDETDSVSISSIESESRGSESSEEKTGSGSSGGGGAAAGNGKRQRTSFTPAQIQTLQEEFRRCSNPSPEDMERISDLTGHPRKVVMIWFQNARARNKKMLLGSGVGSSQPRKHANKGACHWATNPCSPGTVPFVE